VQPSEQNSEWLTRKRLIDPKLKAAGWEIVPFSEPFSSHKCCAIAEFETANGPADYALSVNGKILGVVEAKKLTLGPQSVLMQAERYSKGLSEGVFNFGGYRVPFLYSTNGEVIWFHDIRNALNRSHAIAQFHTPEALSERLAKDFDASCQNLLRTPNDHPRLRPYQREANIAVEKAIADRKQQMLVAMATGTGKTFTMVNQVYRLIKSGVAQRILFLVDRRALAAQAVLAFASFEPEPGLKFDRIYEVYSQCFHRGDFGEDEKYDPKVLPPHYLMLMRTNPKLCEPAFLMYVLNSPRILGQVRELTGGSASPHLNVADIKAFPLPLPSLQEQREIVSRVALLFSLTEAIEMRATTATGLADKLTQSILAKAFRGELVPTEAELARREGREYEPASVLLERIREQRVKNEESQQKPKQRAKRATAHV
jgi:DNA-binding Lrp family transcriptional regulator